jgi:hypothetical protein
MKNLVHSVSASILLSCSSFAQTFSVETANILITHAPVNEYVTGSINLVNNSDESIILGWELLEKITPNGWDYSYCDYNTCYTASSLNGTMALVAPQELAFIKVNVQTLNPGWSYFKFKVFDTNDLNSVDTLEFWFNGTASTPSVYEKPAIKVFPNPVFSSEKITISGIASHSTIQLINSLGQQVYRIENLTSDTIVIDKAFPKGVYLVRISSDGLTESRKLVIR